MKPLLKWVKGEELADMDTLFATVVAKKDYLDLTIEFQIRKLAGHPLTYACGHCLYYLEGTIVNPEKDFRRCVRDTQKECKELAEKMFREYMRELSEFVKSYDGKWV